MRHGAAASPGRAGWALRPDGAGPPDPLPAYTDPARFRIIGKRVPRVDIPADWVGFVVPAPRPNVTICAGKP